MLGKKDKKQDTKCDTQKEKWQAGMGEGKRLVVTFVLTLLVLLLVLVGAAFLPRQWIKAHMMQSARYLCQREVFYQEAGGKSSMVDRYADSILLNIAYHFEGKHPLYSTMKSAYYRSTTQNENENLRDAVLLDRKGNTQYMRYWHGSADIVRLFHLFGDLKMMYLWHGLLMVVLAGVLFWQVRKDRALCISIIAGLVLGGVWWTPFSLEYTWTILLMLIAGILVLRKPSCELFLILGMLTTYLDFLTTETLTLTVPLALFLYKKRDGRACIKRGICWGAGYTLMWPVKWGLASIALGRNALPYVMDHAAERLGGDIGLSLPQYMLGAITRNVGCLFPLEYGLAGGAVFVLSLLVVLYRLYVHWQTGADPKYCYGMLSIALLPFVRFLLLHNHSYLHYFFTYRALMGTVFALGLLVAELTRKHE